MVICAGLIGLYAMAGTGAWPRYFLLLYPFLVTSALGLCHELTFQALRPAETTKPAWLQRTGPGLATGLVAISFAFPLAYELRDALRGKFNVPGFAMARDLANHLGPGSQAIADLGSAEHIGFYTSYLTGRRWHGRSFDALSMDALVASEAKIFVVLQDSDTDDLLSAAEQAEPLAALRAPVSGRSVDDWPVRVYRLVANDD